uniref:Synaptobrevin, longin-like domain protein n=1 Tax=Tanacetum cinerariifolium TaxID=118510 RepID=A0A6L2JIY4_TANCI|nr:hypothetical protein [Tanacetum cinerariifolium]
MIAILEKTEHNIDFHQIVNFLEASHIRYALTICPTVNVSHIRQFWSTTRIETMNQETKILATVDGKSRTISESSLRRHLKLSDEEGICSLPDAELFENLSLMGYNILRNQRFTFQKGQFSHQWKFLIHTIMQCLSHKSTGFNEFSSNIATVVGKGSAIPTEAHHTPSPQELHSPQHDSLTRSHPTTTSKHISQAPTEPIILRKYTRRAKRIAQSKALSPATDEPESLLRDDKQREAFTMVSRLDMAAKIKDQDLEISGLKARVKFLEDKDRGRAEPTQEDAPIKGEIMEIWKEVGVEKSTELGRNNTEEMINVLSSMEAANILTSRVAAASVSPVVGVLAAGVPTVSGSFPTISAIFTTASVIDAQVAKEMKEEFARENQRMSEQLARDSEIARRHAEEELKMMIEGLDRSNEVIAKHLQDYEQVAADLSVREKIEFINELEQREFYMSVLRSHAGWKTRHFRRMTLEQLKEKFTPVWKQFEDFVPMDSKEEGERVKRQGLKIDQGSSKRMMTSEDVSKEKLKEMMQLVPLEEVYVEALQLWTLVKETLSIKQATKDNEKELWVELKRLFEPDFEDQLWTHNQAFMHDPLEWKLYDTYGAHHVSSKDQEIFMLVEKDYPLRKRLATVMISNRLQEVVLFNNGLDVPTRQILDSRRAIPSKTAADAKVAIQEMAEYSQKWHNVTSRNRSTKTLDGLAVIQAQLNNLGREIKKVNEKFMLLKNQGASIKTLEIQIRQMSKVLQERGFGSLPSSTETNPRDHVKSISTIVEADSNPIRRMGSSQYAVSTRQNDTLMYETKQMTNPFLSRLNGYYYEEKEESYGPLFSKANSYRASYNSIPRKEKDPRSFTLPFFINNVCFNNALADLGASVSVIPLSTYLNLGLGKLAHIKLTVELADKTVKYPKEIIENVLVCIGKFVFLIDFIILDMLEDIKVPSILGRPFLSTAHAKIDVFKRKITLRVGE